LRRLGANKTLSLIAVTLLALSIVLAVASLFPVATDATQAKVIINDTFTLSQNQIRRQGLGAFHGGENITVLVDGPANFTKHFSLVTYSGASYIESATSNLNYTFTASADYHEAIFYSDAPQPSQLHFVVSVQQPQVLTPFTWLSEPAKILFFLSLGAAMFILIKRIFARQTNSANKLSLPFISIGSRRRLLALLGLSLVIWIALLAVNTNPLSTFENWYTDHARHSYVSSLFLKDGFAVFSQPLGVLANQDNSAFKFVTWPEMPHLYPIGSILVFLPFGVFLQAGATPTLIYKLEIGLFLVFAHICLYFFLKMFLKKEINVSWKIVGVGIIYLAMIVYAADGMFDSVAFLFSLFAVIMFLNERYDWFFLLVGASVFFKYQAGIFLLPLIVVGVLKLLQEGKFSNLVRNKPVITGFILVCASISTAYLSAPYLLQTRPQFIMNGVNAFAPNAIIPWSIQSTSILLTFAATLIFAFYMRHRNILLSLSAVFLLLPSYTLPYFQNWYIPFIFVYILIPQNKKDIQATMIWLILMIAILSFGVSAFNPTQIIDNLRITLRI
jgi:hypothetical protein